MSSNPIAADPSRSSSLRPSRPPECSAPSRIERRAFTSCARVRLCRQRLWIWSVKHGHLSHIALTCIGGGKNLRLDRDDSPFARRPSGGFSGQQSFGGEINAAGGANAVPLGGRPRWGGSNGGASPAPAVSQPLTDAARANRQMNERPTYAQPQSTSAANGWGGSYASGPANGGAVQNVNSSW